MNDREVTHYCDECGGPIYKGDRYCRFYYDVALCAFHAVTRSQEIELRKAAARSADWEERRHGLSLPTLAEYEAQTERLEAILASDGDAPACMVVSGAEALSSELVAVPAHEAEAAAIRAVPAGDPVTLTYRNYRGEVAERTIIPHRVWFGSTDWHPEPQWLLTAWDAEKNAERDFALKDFGQPAAPAVPDLTLMDPADDEAMAWVINSLSAIRRDNGNMDYGLKAVVRAFQAGKAAAPAVKVRPLVWTHCEDREFHRNGTNGHRILADASAAGIRYELERVEHPSNYWSVQQDEKPGQYYIARGLSAIAGPFSTDIEAKKWAYENLCTRILAALEGGGEAADRVEELERELAELRENLRVEQADNDHKLNIIDEQSASLAAEKALADQLRQVVDDAMWCIGNMSAALELAGLAGTISDPRAKMAEATAAHSKARGK